MALWDSSDENGAAILSAEPKFFVGRFHDGCGFYVGSNVELRFNAGAVLLSCVRGSRLSPRKQEFVPSPPLKAIRFLTTQMGRGWKSSICAPAHSQLIWKQRWKKGEGLLNVSELDSVKLIITQKQEFDSVYWAAKCVRWELQPRKQIHGWIPFPTLFVSKL